MTIKVNQAALNKVLKTVNNAFAEVVTTLGDEFQSVISDPNEFADLGLENQDIVDTGRFKDSQTLNVRSVAGVTVATYGWNPTAPKLENPMQGVF